MTPAVNLVRTVPSAKFICCCWRNPWCDFRVTHTPKCNEPVKILYKQIINFGLTIRIVCLLHLCWLRNTAQLSSGTVDKSKWPVFLQNASGNPSGDTTQNINIHKCLHL